MSAKDPWYTSQAVEQAGTALEGFSRAVLPKKTYETIATATGGSVKDIEARADKFPMTANTAGFVGTMLRDTAALALSPATAILGVGAVDWAGEMGHAVQTHNPEVSGGFVVGKLLSNVFSQGVNRAAQWGLGVAGNAAASGAKTLGKKVLASEAGAAAWQKAVNATEALGGTMDDLVDKAFKSGFVGKTQATRLQLAQKGMAETDGALSSMLKNADTVVSIAKQTMPAAAADAADFGARKAALAEIESASKALTGSHVKPYRNRLNALAKELRETDALTPSRAHSIERDVASIAEDAHRAIGPRGTNTRPNDNSMASLRGLYQQLRTNTDDLLAKTNIDPATVRDLETKYLSHKQMSELASDAPSLMSQAVKVGVSGAAGWAAKAGATAAGLPPWAGNVAAVAVGGTAGGLQGLLKPAGQAAGRAAIAGLQAVNWVSGQAGTVTARRLSQFEREAVEQYVGVTAGEQLWAAARKAVGWASAQAAPSALKAGAHYLSDEALGNVLHYAAHPQAFDHQLQEQISALPLSEQAKQDAYIRAKLDMAHLTKDLPPENPLQPQGARRLTQRARIKIQRRLTALVDPESALSDPNPEALETIKERRAAAHTTFLKGVFDNAGPNIGPSSQARRLLDRLGASDALKQAGRKAQALYAPQPMPAPTARQRPGGGGGSVNINVSTATDNLERGSD